MKAHHRTNQLPDDPAWHLEAARRYQKRAAELSAVARYYGHAYLGDWRMAARYQAMSENVYALARRSQEKASAPYISGPFNAHN